MSYSIIFYIPFSPFIRSLRTHIKAVFFEQYYQRLWYIYSFQHQSFMTTMKMLRIGTIDNVLLFSFCYPVIVQAWLHTHFLVELSIWCIKHRQCIIKDMWKNRNSYSCLTPNYWAIEPFYGNNIMLSTTPPEAGSGTALATHMYFSFVWWWVITSWEGIRRSRGGSMLVTWWPPLLSSVLTAHPAPAPPPAPAYNAMTASHVDGE